MASLSEKQGGEGGEGGEQKVQMVTLGGTEYKPLADGKYDVVILGSGFKECLLAGLLAAVGKKKVLQIDRNQNYGGDCASLSLEEMCERHGKPWDKEAMTKQFGRSRGYQCDLIPKFILAGGRLVKMLITTGVTKYLDFAAVDKSFVYTSGKIYKVPVTPAEAIRTSLVGFFQKRHLRSFAMFLSKYESQGEPTVSQNERLARSGQKAIVDAVRAFYTRHNAAKASTAEDVVGNGKMKPLELLTALETQYGVPVVAVETDVEFGEGSLGLQIDARPVGKMGKNVTRILSFNELPEGNPNRDAQNQISVGDIVSKLNGEDVLWMDYAQLLQKIKASKRPLTLTFMTALPTQSMGESKTASAAKVNGKTMEQLFTEFSLDDNSQCFIGHAMALHTDDTYLKRPAVETVEAVHVYGQSVGVYGDSPYIYPLYGLSNIPEGFARLSAVYGGVNMLRTEFNELFFDDAGKVCGVTATFDEGNGEGPEKLGTTCSVVIGDPSYLDGERRRKTGSIIRSTCILKHPINRTEDAQSAQIIMPSKHLKHKKSDIFISLLSGAHEVTPRNSGAYLAIVSTVVETNNPIAEVAEGIAQLGEIVMRFDDIVDTYEPTAVGTEDNVFVTRSYDATSHFEYESREVMDLYERITGQRLNLNMSMEELQKQASQ
jgi:Rab GDP dissociation inhibitor